jgi:hypothetical protein
VYRISFLRCRGILSTRKQNTKCIGQVILENTVIKLSSANNTHSMILIMKREAM